MGSIIGNIFITPDELPYNIYGFIQVCFLAGTYGYILFNASNLISDGSELLLLVPSISGMVGSIVLPVLGAVPDGAIVLFSGLGPNAQKQLSVGVGTLAGSTIMLLTLPWFLSILAGRVNLNENGDPVYRRQSAEAKLTKSTSISFNLFKTGVAGFDCIKTNGKIMLFTALSYLIIQLPAFFVSGDPPREQAKVESISAAIGAVVTISLFIWYLIYHFQESRKDRKLQDRAKLTNVRVSAIKNGQLTLRGAMFHLLQISENAKKVKDSNRSTALLDDFHSTAIEEMKDMLRPFYFAFDEDKSGKLEKHEVKMLMKCLHENPTDAEFDEFFGRADVDKSGNVDFIEFCQILLDYCVNHDDKIRTKNLEMRKSTLDMSDEDDDEDEEVPDDLAHLSPKQQQSRIKMRAAYMLMIGTALVLLISDPMVDVLSNIGKRTGISSFYIAFIVAPLASNASELIAAFNYARKKTKKSITISFSTLQGAASMNNTFCLSIFMLLIFFGGLLWQYSAETLAILFVELFMFIFHYKKQNTLFDGYIILCLFPFSIMFVYVLEKYFGLD
eukprot:GHVL01026159.1.p1 GENE.GHVL01026159.1~~GHVL01026159.1.p1  ORF type:complete len:558 (-),score=105.83 GHVL01026159.1:995-2668(-)